jgi:hypothetical protein
VDVSYGKKLVVIQHPVDCGGKLTFEFHASLNALYICELPHPVGSLLL